MDINIIKDFMHFYTLIFVQFGVLFVSFISLHLICKLDTNNVGIKFWRDGAFISSVGALSLALFNSLPIWLSVVPGVSGIMIGYVLFWHGTTCLIEKSTKSTRILWSTSIIIIVLMSATVFVEDYGKGYGLRVIAMSFVLTIFPLLSAAKVFSEKHRVTLGTLLLVLAFLGIGVLSLVRMMVTMTDLETKPKPVDLIAFYGYTILYVVLISGLIIFIQEKLLQKLTEQATTDSLTKLQNRRSFYEVAAKVLAQASRKNNYTSLAAFDLDWFKKINDEYGHKVGDMALKHFSSIVMKEVRFGDSVARFGGEEFNIIFPETARDEALIVAERIRKKLETLPLITPSGVQVKMTVSAGIASGEGVEEVETLISSADMALYEAKNSGRNRCVLAQA